MRQKIKSLTQGNASTTVRKQYLLITFDTLIILVSYYLAFLLRFDGNIPELYLPVFLHSLILVTVIRLACLFYFGAYKSINRYAGITELLSLVKAITLGSGLIFLSVFFIFNKADYGAGYPRSVFLIDWLLNIVFDGGVHFFQRIKAALLHNNGNSQIIKGHKVKNVLIYGASDSGEMLLRGINHNHKLSGKYRILGFIDEDSQKRGMHIHGVEVLGCGKDLPQIVADKKIDEIILAIPFLPGKQLREMLGMSSSLYHKLKVVPQLEEVLAGKQHLHIRDLHIEDLLKREKVEFNFDKNLSYLTGKRVLVTGAGGSIGSELCRQIIECHPSQLVLFGRGEHSIFTIAKELRRLVINDIEIREVIGDVINKRKLQGVFKMFNPQVVFHAGADKHVPLMESNPDEAVLNNVLGTLNLLEVTEDFGTELVVCISSDKAVNPSSVMGCCKRITELLVQSRPNKSTVCVAVRFGNVLGSRGSVVPLFKEQIARGGPITITHPDITRFFMTIPEAAQLVIQAGAMGKGGEVFILDMGEPIKIADLAKESIQLAGLTPNDDIAINYIGLRPGEKLYEELYTTHEKIEKTDQNKIWVVTPNGTRNNPGLYKGVKELQALSLDMEFDKILVKLQEIVPEFKSPHVLQ